MKYSSQKSCEWDKLDFVKFKDSLVALSNIEKDVFVRYVIDCMLNCCNNVVIDDFHCQKIVPCVIDEFDVVAIIDDCRLTLCQWRKLVWSPKLFLDLDVVCVLKKRWPQLGESHGKIYHGDYFFEAVKGEVKEHLKYWWKDPASEFLSCVQRMIEGEKSIPFT